LTDADADADAETEAIARSRRWLEHFVIGLGLCPFAARPFDAGRILFRATAATGRDPIYRGFLATLDEVVMDDAGAWDTALFVVSRGLAEFDDYLDALAAMEAAVTTVGLDGVIQLASFHPHYRFTGAPADDPANFSNRSPLPMIHLIREDHLAAALAGFPAPDSIPRRNVERLRALGADGIRRMLRQVDPCA
jgi:hypothetical protein